MTKPTGKPNGCPSKYNPKIHPGIVRKLASCRMIEEDMANVLGIGHTAFYDWKNAHPEFAEAITEGKKQPISEVEGALFKLCKGYTFKDGLGLTRVKHPDIKAIQFYLKNVDPEHWRDKQEHSGPGGGPIQTDDLSKLSNDELRERLKILREG